MGRGLPLPYPPPGPPVFGVIDTQSPPFSKGVPRGAPKDPQGTPKVPQSTPMDFEIDFWSHFGTKMVSESIFY